MSPSSGGRSNYAARTHSEAPSCSWGDFHSVTPVLRLVGFPILESIPSPFSDAWTPQPCDISAIENAAI